VQQPEHPGAKEEPDCGEIIRGGGAPPQSGDDDAERDGQSRDYGDIAHG
jgi:hypothetical protein